MNRASVIVFVKAPRAGKVKTRLGADIGMGRAAALFRIMTQSTISEVANGDWSTHLGVDPVSVFPDWQNVWPKSLKRIAQGDGSLGARMARVIARTPPGPVVIIGADAPGLRARHLRQAFAALRGADAVFGPAEDGGYWLIGIARRRGAPELFRDVRWSTRHALEDTLATLPQAFRVRFLETLRDVDVAADLPALGLRSAARSAFAADG